MLNVTARSGSGSEIASGEDCERIARMIFCPGMIYRHFSPWNIILAICLDISLKVRC